MSDLFSLSKSDNVLLMVSVEECYACELMEQAFDEMDNSILNADLFQIKLKKEMRCSKDEGFFTSIHELPSVIWYENEKE